MSTSSPHSERPAAYSAAFNFEELIRRLDEQCATLQPPLIDQFRFKLDGMAFEVRRVKRESGDHFVIAATVGQLPFTGESAERRSSARAVIEGAGGMPHVHFAIDYTGKITAGGVVDTAKTDEPHFIFYPLILFLQEAQPFIQLIRRYL